MLVLTRRADQKIVFPNVGITLKVLRVRGNIVKVGVDAPKSVKILRDEIAGQASRTADAKLDIERNPQLLEAELNLNELPRELAHEIRNRLNAATIATHLVRRQLDAGRHDDVESTLQKVLNELAAVDHELSRRKKPVEKQTEKSSKTLKSLLVEDDQNESELLAGFLRLSGCEVDVAGDGCAALEYLDDNPLPDFVLLDMMMPRCNGPETVSRIRSNPHTADLRVYAVSGTDPFDVGVPTGPAGVDRWFPKPLNPEVLVSELHKEIA